MPALQKLHLLISVAKRSCLYFQFLLGVLTPLACVCFSLSFHNTDPYLLLELECRRSGRRLPGKWTGPCSWHDQPQSPVIQFMEGLRKQYTVLCQSLKWVEI